MHKKQGPVNHGSLFAGPEKNGAPDKTGAPKAERAQDSGPRMSYSSTMPLSASIMIVPSPRSTKEVS